MQIDTHGNQATGAPKFSYTNTQSLLNSNIQYQFLKYNGFKPMKPHQYPTQYDRLAYGYAPNLSGTDPFMPSPDVFGYASIKKSYLPYPPKIWPHGLLSNEAYGMMPCQQIYNPQYDTF